MPKTENQIPPNEQKLLERIQSLEARVTSLENSLALAGSGTASSQSAAATESAYPPPAAAAEKAADSGIEFRIGEFGLAWVGSLVLLLGLVFVMTYLFSIGYVGVGSLFGYLATVALYLLARYWQQNFRHMAFIMLGSSLLLLYYTTMRLHFFSTQPLTENVHITLLLLLAVFAVQIFVAIKNGSQLLACIAILLGMTSALLSDRTHLWLPLVAFVSAFAVILAIRYGWWRLLVVSIVSAYFSYLLWLLNNPIMGHPLRAVAEHQYSLIYLFIYATIFALPSLLKKTDAVSDLFSIAMTLLNGLGLSLLTFIVVLTFFAKDFGTAYLALAAFFLLLAIVEWERTHRQFEPSFYACFGFMALSIAIFGFVRIPLAFFWLSLQSLLVVSMALWFRSKIIVVVNSFIYLGILLAYLIHGNLDNMTNISFAVVALASARIMNWKKERLTLRTDFLRIQYLVAAFVMVLLALQRIVPREYVSLSWTAAAAGYFLLSIILKNIKYRWMAIFTMLATVIYLFFVDLARLDATSRVVAFLFLGLILLAISLYYTKFKQRMRAKED